MTAQNKITRKGISIFLIITLLMTGFYFSPINSFAATRTITETKTINDLAYYDIWKHSDGTWQKGIKQGSSVSATYTISVSGVIPSSATVINCTGVFDNNYNNPKYYDNSVVNGYLSAVPSFNPIDRAVTYTVNTTLTTNTGLNGFDIKEAWQTDIVEGYRYYIPTEIEITYTVETTVGDFEPDLDLPSSAKQGETYTASDATTVDSNTVIDHAVLEKHYGDGNWETVATWEGPGESGKNTGESVNESCEDICTITYKLTVFDTNGQSKAKSKSIDIIDGREIDGKAILELPEYTYEGHPALAKDVSVFTVSGVNYSARRAYEEGVAENDFIPLPNSAGSASKKTLTTADVVFTKRGNYNVKLEVNTVNGNTLADIKPIEVRKTPYIVDNLGGFQKENRKQILSISVATYPGKPIIDYYVKLKDMVTGQEITLTKDQPQQNNTTIKTRAITSEGDSYWTNYELLFLTKNIDTRDYRYTIYMKNSKGDTDTVQKTFKVNSDLPPTPEIIMQDSFIRNKGTNVAEIMAEDASTTDGDQLERTWSVKGQNVKTIDGYKDLSFGTGQKVMFNKTGVGKVKLDLFLNDVWIEPTLEEYITDADYKTATITKTSDVINIAPTVRLEPINTKEADIVIVTDKAHKTEIESSVNTLKAALIEKGFDPHISLAVAADADEEPYRKVASWLWDVTVNCSICNHNTGQMDSDYIYRITSPGKVRQNYQDICVANQSHVLQALSAGNTAGSGYVAWSYPVNESRNFTFYLDNKEKYVYIACYDTNKTTILSRVNGAYLTTLNIAIPSMPYVSDDAQNLYFIGSTIQKYDTSTGKLSTVTNRSGSCIQMLDGKITFVGKKETGVKQNGNGTGFYIGKFNLNSEMIEEIAIPDLPNASGIVYPQDMDNSGKVLFRQGSNIWIADTVKNTVKTNPQAGVGNTMTSTVFVRNEKGEGIYVAHAYNNTDSDDDAHFYFNLYDFNGASITSAASYYDKYYGHNWNGISYAKLHSKENKIYIFRGAVFDSLEAGLSHDGHFFTISLPSMSIDTNMYKWGWDIANESASYNGSLMSTFYMQERWIGMQDRIQLFRNSITELEAKTYALRQAAPSGNNDSEKYIIVAGDNSASQILQNQAFNDEIEMRSARSLFFDINDSINSIAEKIEDLGDSLKNFLFIEGDSSSNKASLDHEIQLLPNIEYEYEYTMTTTGKAIDLFGVKNPNSQGRENDNKYFEKVAAFIDFNSGLSETFFAMSGGGTNTERYPGYGTSSWGNRASAFSFSFSMEKEGYVSFDLFISGAGYKTSTNIVTYYVDGVLVGTEGVTGYTPISAPRILYLDSGSHTITMYEICNNGVFNGYASINNLKAVYYEDTADAFTPATVGSKNGEAQTVSNSFRVAGQEGMEIVKVLNNAMTTKSGIEYSKYISSSSTYDVEYWDNVKHRYYWVTYTGSPLSLDESTGIYFLSGSGDHTYPRFNITAPADKFLIYSYSLSYAGGNIDDTSQPGERLYPGTETRILRPGQTQTLSATMGTRSKGDRIPRMYVSNICIAEFNATDFGGAEALQTQIVNVKNKSIKATSGASSLLLTIDETTGSINAKLYIDLTDTSVYLNDGISLSTSESSEKISALVSNFSLYKKIGGIRQLIFSQNFNSQTAMDLTGWKTSTVGNGKAEIVSLKAPLREEEVPLVYKKGQLVAYNIYYDDYENDPSKKQYWRYTHTPMNDGPNPQAAFILDEDGQVVSSTGAILSQSIPRFYIDGKYTVEHWQEDNTNRTGNTSGSTDYTKYDKLSNVESITFYIQGGATAPWITSIKTIPPAVKEGDQYQLQIGVDDVEKDILRLTTEVYKDKKLIYTHKQTNIVADANGTYPCVTTGYPPIAEPGRYDVVCTVRDWAGAGIGAYKFTVVSEGKITGFVDHTDQWDDNRKKYNLKRFSEEVNRPMQFDEYLTMSAPRKRGTNVFWSGEKFMLQSETEGKPTSVRVQIFSLDANGERKSAGYSAELFKTGKKTASGAELWGGSLWDNGMINKWGRKAPERLLFSFTAYYSGGTTKNNEAMIIVDSRQDYWQLHRLW